MNGKLTIGSLVIAVGLACSSGSKGLTVRAQANDGTGAPAATSLTIDNGVILDRVVLVVRSVELEPDACPGPTGPTGSTGPTGPTGGVSPMHDGGGEGGVDGDDDECELQYGPFPVDLSGDALASGIHWQFEVPVPAGTYREIEFKVNTINANKAGADPVLADMAARHASILVEGHLDANTPFTFAVPFEVEQEREGAITVDQANGAAITLDIVPTHWFSDASGNLLDPRVTENQGAIRDNIRASIRVEHDDDADGCDDTDATCEAEHHDRDGTGGSGSGQH